MTGAEIIGALLRADAQLLELVPAERIKGGRLPEDAPVPSLLVRTVSSVDRQPLKRGARVRVTDRVSVTGRAASLRELGVIIARARIVCAGRTGDTGGGWNVSISTAGKGPDLNGPGNTFEQAQDFRVGFDDLT